jgi:hypothetical protein
VSEAVPQNSAPRSLLWRNYFEAVTLGAFGTAIGGPGGAERFIFLLKGMKVSRFIFHFFIITLAVNFPVMFAVARLPPYELFSRFSGGTIAGLISGSAEDFNFLMYQNAYGRTILLPVIGGAFVLVLVLQIGFYVLAALGLGLQRMTLSPLSFRNRLGLLLFSSTPAALLTALFGLWLPTVHIVVFYLAVIILGFRRSALCPNG